MYLQGGILIAMRQFFPYFCDTLSSKKFAAIETVDINILSDVQACRTLFSRTVRQCWGMLDENLDKVKLDPTYITQDSVPTRPTS